MRVLGVDGCPQGWVVVALEDGAFVEAWVVPRFAGLVGDAAAVIGVDIPLGETTPGARAADAAAREWLGRRHSAIFTPPPLEAAVADGYDDAKRIALARTGKMVSKQAWHLLPKMLDVYEHWQREPDRIREVHPECSFRAMHGEPLEARKTSWPGLVARLSLLRARGIDLVEGSHDTGDAKADDVVDAAAVAWTAHRLARGAAGSLPDPPERDADGRAVAIWF